MLKMRKSKLHQGLFLCAVVMVPAHAQAAVVFKGDVVGAFSNVTQLSGDFVSISNHDNGRKPMDEAVFQWGAASFRKSCGGVKNNKCKVIKLPHSGSSSMSFDGIGSDKLEKGYTASLGQVFLLGNFRSTNRSAYLAKGVNGVDLTLDLGLQGLTAASPFTYHIDIADDPKQNPDKISLSSPNSPFQFSYGGQNYMFSLLGFSKDKGKSFLPELTLNENSSARLGLYGRFDVASASSSATPVPLPAAWGLMSVGLLGFSTIVRKAKKNS